MVPVYGYCSYFIIEEGGTSVIEIERRIEEEMSRCFFVLFFLYPNVSAWHQGAYLAARLLYFFILVSPLF